VCPRAVRSILSPAVSFFPLEISRHLPVISYLYFYIYTVITSICFILDEKARDFDTSGLPLDPLNPLPMGLAFLPLQPVTYMARATLQASRQPRTSSLLSPTSPTKSHQINNHLQNLLDLLRLSRKGLLFGRTSNLVFVGCRRIEQAKAKRL